MISVAIVIGSTRPGRVGEAVGRWGYDIAQQRRDAKFELSTWELRAQHCERS